MANVHLEENPPPSPPLSSIPLHLSGFLAGDTIHVDGNAGNLHISGHFDIHHKQISNHQFHFPSTNTLQNPSPISSLFPSVTPSTTHEEKEDQIIDTNPTTHVDKTPQMFNGFNDFEQQEFDLTPTEVQIPVSQDGDTTDELAIITRLRSGVISPVTYFSRRCVGESSDSACRNSRSSTKLKMRREGRERREVLKRVLRRHSFPVKPCNSYTFFVMMTWESAKASSFEETSRRLGEMWCKLPHEEKKVFESMAFKDNARYKKQCLLLRSKEKDFGRWRS